MSLVQESQVIALQNRIELLEQRIIGMSDEMSQMVQSELVMNGSTMEQAQCQFGLYTVLCIDTIDIWKQNRVRWFSPLFHDPSQTVSELPWANAVSSMGGFDDCGLNWVPPAGSTLCILFENGNRAASYYIGTTWQRNRGPDGQHNWGFNVAEYNDIWDGKRGGYMVGPNDGSQCLPPNNTENYNGYDITSIVDFNSDPNSQNKLTYPNIYSMATPEKHRIKLVDGDPKCNRKWKRIEIMSSCGNWMMFKDDHLHYAGQWANPKCGGKLIQDGNTNCSQFGYRNNQSEEVDCSGEQSNSDIIGGHPSTGSPDSKYYKSQVGANPFFKHSQECRPYKGPPTPQNNVCDLPQSGIQFMSISGHTFVMDDSVEEPSGIPTWDREFDFGCNDHYVGTTYWLSATGHKIELSDIESPEGDSGSQLRGSDNYIRLLTANGIKVELNDHTVYQKDCPGCPPNVGGSERGFHVQSSSNHTFDMVDEEVAQCSPCRMSGGVPIANAKKAFVRIRTGYGLEMTYNDDFSQENTQQQYIQIFCPQKDNTQRGPHIHRYQEAPSGPGLVFLRVGGNYVVSTYDNHVTIVGEEENPSDLIEVVTNINLVYTKDVYINVTDKLHLFYAKEVILLLAGQDCSDDPNNCGGCGGTEPCIGAVIVYDFCTGCVRISDRVFASTSANAPQLSMFQLAPLMKCTGC